MNKQNQAFITAIDNWHKAYASRSFETFLCGCAAITKLLFDEANLERIIDKNLYNLIYEYLKIVSPRHFGDSNHEVNTFRFKVYDVLREFEKPVKERTWS